MKIKLILLCIVFINISVYGQTILNGSFETNTATVSQDNLSNVSLNSLVNNVYGFGEYNQIDLYKGDSWATWTTPYSQNGNWRLGLGTNVSTGKSDAFAFGLSTPLTIGKTYNLSYYDIARNVDPPGGQIEIGISTTNDSFGTLIYTSPIANANNWTLRSFNFTPTISAQYITVRAVVGNASYGFQWTFVDNFILSSNTDIPTDFIEDDLKIYPNPSSGIVNIELQKNNTSCDVEIYDMFGRKILSYDSVLEFQQIDMCSYDQGIYFVKVYDGSAFYIKKLLLEYRE